MIPALKNVVNKYVSFCMYPACICVCVCLCEKERVQNFFLQLFDIFLFNFSYVLMCFSYK